jgi:DNA-binding CsgD family transcriptional regulator
MKINIEKEPGNRTPVNTFIRKLVTTDNDSVANYNNVPNGLKIPYSLNSVNIYYSATEYPLAQEVLYRYRLKGQDEKWSIPSPKTMKEYTHLTEGQYVFEVKAYINGVESEGNIASISFEILPPWYRSYWAYFGYLAVFILLLIELYRKTIQKQKRMARQKGRELEARSRQYEREKALKDKEIYELQNEKLQSSLNFKMQELTGYILNLIRKNEMLENVKKEVLNISKSLEDNTQPATIKQKVIRLISLINNNIERDKDFEAFQSNFNLMHKDFFKLLDDKFPGLTRNDKILCAYLKMNLSSKEIAPLQNISVRGVEINRYRLRKKMNLDRDVNLTEFLQSISP